MTRRQIVLTIDCDYEYGTMPCVNCEFMQGADHEYHCEIFSEELENSRLALCLAAEARFRALVEAGESNAASVAFSFGAKSREAWDRAVKEEGK